MPVAALFPKIATVPALAVVFDGVKGGIAEAEHDIEVHTTQVPIEGRSKITDNASLLPEKLTLTGISTTISIETAPKDTWSAIRKLRNERTLMDIDTEWGPYTNMLLKRAQGGYLGRGGRFMLYFEEKILVDFERPPVPSTSGPAAGRNPAVDRGRVATVPIGPNQER